MSNAFRSPVIWLSKRLFSTTNRSYRLTQSKVQRSQLYEAPLNFSHSDDLASYLGQEIVAIHRDFVVLNKPVNVSVLGQSLAQIEAQKLVYPQFIQSSAISIQNCLPQLAQIVLQAERTKCCQDQTDLTTDQLPKLYIVESLPFIYSGLILLARNLDYAKSATKFYENARLGGTLWNLYQQFLLLCWNKPFRTEVSLHSFPIASYQLNDNLLIGYRPSDNELSQRFFKDGSIVRKHVQHKCLETVELNASLIELATNSVYRGLPEVCLLYEGCVVLGEMLQSARLTQSGISTLPLICHPSKTIIDHQLPPNLIKALGGSKFDLSFIPVHIHRSSLIVPIPNRSPLQSFRISPYVHSNRYRLHGFQSKSWTWTKVDDKFFLTFCSPTLPKHWNVTMDCLKFEFDYSNDWFSNKIKRVE